MPIGERSRSSTSDSVDITSSSRACFRERRCAYVLDCWDCRGRPAPLLAPPADGRATVPLDDAPRDWLEALGFAVVGPLAIRVDLLEKVAAEARRRARQRRPSPVEPLPSWLGASIDDTVRVLRSLGFGVQTLAIGTILVRSKKRRRRA